MCRHVCRHVGLVVSNPKLGRVTREVCTPDNDESSRRCSRSYDGVLLFMFWQANRVVGQGSEPVLSLAHSSLRLGIVGHHVGVRDCFSQLRLHVSTSWPIKRGASGYRFTLEVVVNSGLGFTPSGITFTACGSEAWDIAGLPGRPFCWFAASLRPLTFCTKEKHVNSGWDKGSEAQ